MTMTDTDEDFLLGESPEEYAKRREAMQSDVWIKGFLKGETRVRILNTTKQMQTYREHYKKDIGGFPCGEDWGRFCPAEAKNGLETDANVQRRTRRYVFNALDERGNLNLYRAGKKLYEKLERQEQRKGSITNADYTIVRSGESLETEYDPERGEQYPLDGPAPEPHDIKKVITAQYKKALQAYGVNYKGHMMDDQAPEPDEAQSAQTSRPRLQMAKAKVAEPVVEQATEPVVDPSFDATADVQDFEVLTAPELKAWLDYREVEYPRSEPRPRLAKRASEWAPF